MKKLFAIFEQTHPVVKRAARFFVAALVVGLGTALVRDTVYQGQDFLVFWRAGRALLDGQAVYSIARDGAMVYKYPPWTVPFFVPFALLPEVAARWCFGVFNLVCLFAIFRWLKKSGLARSSIVLCAFLFWGIWAVHALDGQIGLFMLALGLHLFAARERPWAQGLLVWVLSFKLFPLFLVPLFFRPRAWFSVASSGALVCLVLSFPIFLRSPTGTTVRETVTHWLDAARSGGTQFGDEKIRGRDNQGLPALAMRALKIPASDTRADLIAALVIFMVVGLWFLWISKNWDDDERYLAAWALLPALHPLAWFHLFVWAFPFAVLRVSRSETGRSLALALIAVSAVALFTQRTLFGLGQALELLSIKSLGVAALILLAGPRVRKSRPPFLKSPSTA